MSYPLGGQLRWDYNHSQFLGGRYIREVQARHLKMSLSATELAYSFSYPDAIAGDQGRSWHQEVKLLDLE